MHAFLPHPSLEGLSTPELANLNLLFNEDPIEIHYQSEMEILFLLGVRIIQLGQVVP
jgi:hypothetical protein